MSSSSEVTAADIARIAGVGRAAVSNWRRRHPDFPQPVGGPPNSPTFLLADVQTWLASNGRAQTSAQAARLHSTRGVAGATADARKSIEYALVTSMVALLPPLSAGTVLDPVSSDGMSVIAAAKRFGPRLRYVVQAPDAASIEPIAAELIETGASARKIDVAEGSPFIGNALTGYERQADAVISVPPTLAGVAFDDVAFWEFGPPSRNDSVFALAQACFAYVKPGGVAVIAVPFSASTRANGRRIRAEMLRAGVLTHVIGLPERFAAGPSGPYQIWILQRPVKRPSYSLRMVDLTGRDPSRVPHDGDGWQALFADPAHTRDVPAIELLDDDVLLVPSAHVATEPRDVSSDYRDLAGAYRQALAGMPATPPDFSSSRPAEWTFVMVADLVRGGALEIRDHRRGPVEPGDVLVPLDGGFDRISVVGAADRAADGMAAGTADGMADANMTDTNMTDTNMTGASRVESAPTIDGGVAIRCDPNQIDPHFLACFLRSEANRRQAVGTLGGTFRLDVRRARVPRIPLEEQRRYGESFRQLMAFAGEAERVSSVTAAVVSTAVYGLTVGTFAPASIDPDATPASNGPSSPSSPNGPNGSNDPSSPNGPSSPSAQNDSEQ